MLYIMSCCCVCVLFDGVSTCCTGFWWPFWSPVGMPRMALQELRSSSSACASSKNDDNKWWFNEKNGSLITQLFVVGHRGWFIIGTTLKKYLKSFHSLGWKPKATQLCLSDKAIQSCKVQAPQQKLCIFKLVIHLGLLDRHNDICS